MRILPGAPGSIRTSRTLQTFALLFAFVTASPMAPVAFADNRDGRAEFKARRTAMNAVKSWAIQLRFIDRSAMLASPFDLVVIDHAPHPKKDIEIPFKREEILPLKQKLGGGRRIVLAYLSIGEAERYRYYWNPAWDNPDTRPKWLGAENPRWPGDYLVDFASPDWQSVIFGQPGSYLDSIQAAGFDGVFLDRVDAFQDIDETVPGAEDSMQRFVSRLSDYAHRKDPNFLIVMQNAEELAKSKSLLARIDGIAKEDLVFGADNSDAENPKQMITDGLNHLRRAKRSGLRVLMLEYARTPEKILQVRQLAQREGFVLHLTDRMLGVLQTDGVVPATAGGDGTPPSP